LVLIRDDFSRKRKIEMYHPTTRVLTVLELLQAHRQMSGPRLAERLEVDVRSVRRYITMLQDLGIPIETERGRYGNYRLMRGFKLPPLMFTEDEALALTLGLLAAKRLGLTMAAPAVEGALAKFDRVLPEALRQRVQAVQETLVLDSISTDTYRSSPESSVVLTLSIATQQEKRIWMRYQSGQAAETERAIDPYGLIFHAGLWYTVGYCHLRQDLRMFRLDRVLQAEVLEETFTRPPNFNSLDYLRRSIASMPGTWKVEVLLEMPLEEAERQVPPTMAMLEQDQEEVVMSCYTQDLDWMAHFLINLRCPLIVREPVELHEALRKLAGEIMQLADRSEERSSLHRAGGRDPSLRSG
jgi:predicted DNA-binding transcriptional regulator YafY